MSDAVHILPGFCADAAREAIGVERVFEMGDLVGDTADLVGARRIVLWLEPSLDDQLTLASLPALLDAVGASPEHIDLIQFPTSSVGTSSLDAYAAPPPPVTLSPRDLDELRRAWSALVAPEPDALFAAARSDYEPLPSFTRALRALLLRYPEKISGVNAAELRLLERSRGGAPAARVIGEVLGELLRGVDRCGDDWLFRRLLRLGDPSLAQPPIELSGSTSAYRFVSGPRVGSTTGSTDQPAVVVSCVHHLATRQRLRWSC
jgi:hypothetical protein